ncbi:MAG TPA: hypothetical protein PKA41_03510 [Verrucomicrobiota bacterium]|nr:hypothetical protein [Verrucomicrobiota bacterium]
MRGDVVHRVYGVHEGREADVCFGTYRSVAEAKEAIDRLLRGHGKSWAQKYHDKGFVIRETLVETDFQIPLLPKPRDKYVVKTVAKPNRPGTWDSTIVQVFRRVPGGGELEQICEFERNYSLLQTFEPFRQGGREFALISRSYTKTAVLDLASGQVIAEETEGSPGAGFCPVGFYVPDWWDIHDGSIIPGSHHWNSDKEWPRGTFGFVWGCHWGDDSSWKIQYLDLRSVEAGVIKREERFGYVELATHGYLSPSLNPTLTTADKPSAPPPFISIERYEGDTRLRFAVEMGFELDTGRCREWRRLRISEMEGPETS